MDGYEYERKVLWPMWNKEFMSQNASDSNSTNTKERLKEIGLEINTKDPIEIGGENKRAASLKIRQITRIRLALIDLEK